MQLKPSHLTGYGKKLWAAHKQKGGSWSDFTNWVKGAANKVADVGKTIYEKAIKPAYQYAKDSKILSTVADKVGRTDAGSALRSVGLGKNKAKGVRKAAQAGGMMVWNGYDPSKYAGMVNRPKLQPKPMLGAGVKGVQFG